VVALLALACGTSAPPAATTAPAVTAADAVRITVRHLAGEDAWSVEYQLPRPVQAVRFWTAYAPRRLEWRVAAPLSLSLWGDGDSDLIQRPDRAPFDTFVLWVPNTTSRPEKAHRLVVPYSDGGRVMFTGHLEVVPLDCRSSVPAPCAGEALAELPMPTSFTLVPRPSERVVAQRRLTAGSPAPAGAGTYVYFGSSRALRSPHMTTVVDEALPRWLDQRLEELVPRLVALYAQRTGQALRARPVLFVSYEELPLRRGVDIEGGARSGAVQIHVRLGVDNRRPDDRAAREELSIKLAHELAHLWNAHLFEGDGLRDSSWLHEGGADAFAYRALLELREIDSLRYRQHLSWAASLCAAGLEGQPLVASSARPGHAGEFYTCGFLVAALSEAASPPGSDVFTLWARIFAAAERGRYDEALFWRTLDATTGSPGPGIALRALVHAPQEDTLAFVADLLARAGADLVIADDGPLVDLRRLAINRLSTSLASADCDSLADLRAPARRSRADIAAAAPCRTLVLPDRDRGGTRMATHDLQRRWPDAYDAARERCAQGQPVDVVIDAAAPVPLPCQSPLPPRPRYLRVASWPPIDAPTAQRPSPSSPSSRRAATGRRATR
jgi:hypothetical protein